MKKFNIHDWKAKQHLNEQKDFKGNIADQTSMSNADIKSLQNIVGEYSLNKILNTIAAIADRMGKDEADMIKKLANQIQDFDPSFEPGYRGNPTDMDDDPRMDPAIRSDFDDPILEQTPTVFDDESMDELGDIISKYVEDPDDVQRELDRFDDGGFDNMSDMVTANLDRDPEYKAWYNKLHSIKGDEIEISLEDLDFETLKKSFPKNYQKVKFTRPETDEPYYEDGISFPNLDDSMAEIGDSSALEDWKSKTSRRFGNVMVILKPEGKNWFDKVFVNDEKFNQEREKFVRGKMSAMQKDMNAGRSIDESYQKQLQIRAGIIK